MKREDQQDATIRYLLLTSVSTCFGHHYAHFQENKGLLLHLVCCSVTSGKTWILAVKSFLCSKPSWEIRVSLRMLCVNGCRGATTPRHPFTHCVLTSCKTAPVNRYQPHPAEPEQRTKCSNRAFVLLKMGIMMPETC